MKTFTQRLYEIGDEAEKYIQEVVKDKIVFVENPIDDFEQVLDMPIISYPDGNGDFKEYGITSIVREENMVIIHASHREDTEEEIQEHLYCISAEECIHLADFLQAHIKETSNTINT